MMSLLQFPTQPTLGRGVRGAKRSCSGLAKGGVLHALPGNREICGTRRFYSARFTIVAEPGRVHTSWDDRPPPTREDKRMLKLAAIAAAISLSPQRAPGHKSLGGVLRITHRDSPASMSIHEEGTISVVLPMMGVFNNLVVFDPHAPQNALEGIVPDLAKSWTRSEDGND